MEEIKIDSTFRLNNGVDIPRFGFGTYRARRGSETENAILWALEAGYRLIDTAALYGNEKSVGIAIKKSEIPRSEIFVTTKLWNSDHGYDSAIQALELSLKKLNLDYVDLYLIHWPVRKTRLESWRALEKLLNSGNARAIGVSNYRIDHLEELIEVSNTLPCINQVEFSPYTFQRELLDYCNTHDIQLEAYSPLTKGRKLNDPKLLKIASDYSKTAAQILLRWCLQKNIVVISKSSSKERIIENAGIFNFTLNPKDMEILDGFDENLRTGWNPYSEKLFYA